MASDPKQEAIDYWKDWHRKLADSLPDLEVYESSCTLSAVRELVERERHLAQLTEGLYLQVKRHNPKSRLAKEAEEYLSNRR